MRIHIIEKKGINNNSESSIESMRRQSNPRPQTNLKTATDRDGELTIDYGEYARIDLGLIFEKRGDL